MSALSAGRGFVVDVALLFLRTLGIAAAGRFSAKAAVRECHHLGVRSLGFVVVTMSFIGMIMVLQGGYQARRLIGDFTLLGPGFLQLLVREFAPTIGALMITTRVGAGIAAELGSMSVTEQIDAIRMCGGDPIEDLVAPRFLAAVVMIPAVLVLAAAGSELAGLVTARIAFEVPYDKFFNTRLLSGGDVALGLIKSFTFAGVIPVVSARAGLRARGGSRGVGEATTRAVIDSSITIIFLDFVLNVGLYPLYGR